MISAYANSAAWCRVVQRRDGELQQGPRGPRVSKKDADGEAVWGERVGAGGSGACGEIGVTWG